MSNVIQLKPKPLVLGYFKEELTGYGHYLRLKAVISDSVKVLPGSKPKQAVLQDNGIWEIEGRSIVSDVYPLLLNTIKSEIDNVKNDLSIEQDTNNIKILELILKKATTSLDKLSSLHGLNDLNGYLNKDNDFLVRRSEFDTNPYLVGMSNGVLNIKTKKLYTRDEIINKNILVSLSTNTVYDPEAEAPLFLKALSEYMLGDDEMCEYLLFQLASTLVARKRDKFIIWIGSGGNGKTTITTAVRHAMGKYAVGGHDASDAAGDNGMQLRAQLNGVRFYILNETDKESIRNMDKLIKQTTDSDEVSGKFLYEDIFTFVPVYQTVFTVNHLPDISSDPAVWRRLIITPWDYSIPESEKRSSFTEDLKKEASGIINLLLDTLLELIEKDFKILPPKKIRDMNKSLLSDCDIFGMWVTEIGISEINGSTLKEAREEFNIYCKGEINPNYNIGPKGFKEKIADNGQFDVVKASGNKLLLQIK